METRKHIAAEKLENGTHNCAQAIICTYADLVGIDEETGRNLGNAFGSGMATQCKMLKGVGTGVVLRQCNGCVADAAEFLEEQL